MGIPWASGFDPECFYADRTREGVQVWALHLGAHNDKTERAHVSTSGKRSSSISGRESRRNQMEIGITALDIVSRNRMILVENSWL